MSNDNSGSAGTCTVQSFLNENFAGGIQRAGRFIQK